jgi:hypothetical protein
MALRTFRDSTGVEWRIWDVRPQWTDRRDGKRRQESDPDFAGPDRRKLPGRRWGAADLEPRVRVRSGFEHGWLACESKAGRRRYAPIPEHWEELPEPELELLCVRATATAARPGRLLE